MKLKRPSPGQDISRDYFPMMHDHILGGGLVKGDGETIRVNCVDGAYFIKVMRRPASPGGGTTALSFQLSLYSEGEGESATYKVGMSTGGKIYSNKYASFVLGVDPLTEDDDLVDIDKTKSYNVFLSCVFDRTTTPVNPHLVVSGSPQGALPSDNPTRWLLGMIHPGSGAPTISQYVTDNIHDHCYLSEFAAIPSSKTTIKIGAVVDVANQAILGRTVHDVAAADVTVSASGYVQLKITCAAGVYSFAYSIAAALTAQTDTDLYLPIAYAWWDSDNSEIAAVQQIQRGPVFIPGRVVS